MKTIHFICSPSLGILDNWLPILSELKKTKDLKIAIIFPKAAIIEHISDLDLTIQLAKTIFDEVIFQTYLGNWSKVSSIDEAYKINNRSQFKRTLDNNLTKLESRLPFKFVSGTLKMFKGRELTKCKSRMIDIVAELQKSSAILFDVVEESKNYNNYLEKLPLIKKFSLCHGINVDINPIIKRSYRKRIPDEVFAYLFSDAERQYYQSSFDLSPEHLKVIGIPRHESQWMDHVIKSGHYDLPKTGDYVFLISRSLSPYFPFERKKQALIDIKKVIVDELNFKVIVKKHPKEQDDGLFEEIFGLENQGKTWLKTSAHPFIVGKLCKFAISFYSGVALDMTVLNKPTIEYLNLKGLKDFDNSESFRDAYGTPVMSYRYLGLVLGVSSDSELRSVVQGILHDPVLSMKALTEKYQHYFNTPQGAISKMTNDILNAVGKFH